VVKLCPGCEYLVPSSWDACERCGTALDHAEPVEPLVQAASTRIAGPRPDLGVPGPGRAAAASARDWDPPPVPRRAARRESAWIDSDDQRRRNWRIPVIGPIAVIVAVVSLFVAWNRFTHPPVPVALRPWAEHNAGVTFAPDSAGFRVRLPSTPTLSSAQITLGSGLEGSAEVAVSRVGQYEIGAVWLAVPDGTLDVDGSDPLTTAGDLAGRAGNFEVEVPSDTHHGGLAALTAEVSQDNHDGNALVVVNGSWVYAVVISGPGDLATAFAHLRNVFVLT
jgi:hypothetical protein